MRPEVPEAAAGRWPPVIPLLALAAVLLRLVLLTGRGDYLAFDEGWYLLLGRSLMTGDGFSIIGLPHTALSPLFPVLAGALGAILDSWVWGGRIVAAVASGLLVLPAWAIFRRLATRRVALTAVVLVAVLPSLAPFVVPFWIGADLWVGAEPLLHLFVYTGVAAWLWADEGGSPLRWAVAGAAFGLALLARPEAIIVWGLLGLAAVVLAVRHRSPRRLAGALLMGLAFLLVASPYWLYLHETTGRWTLTGRGVAPAAAAAQLAGAPVRSGAARTIERMLWSDDTAYERRLYGLDASGLRLRSGYWGVYPDAPPAPDETTPAQPEPPAGGPAPGPAPGPEEVAASPSADPSPPERSRLALFLAAMGTILSPFLWPFVVLGVAQPRSRSVLRREIPVAAALLGTSLAIAALVAVDPRTQLFLVPLLAFYAARGFALVEEVLRDRMRQAELRPGFVHVLLAASAVVWLLGINGQRLYRSLVYGSPHHVVAEQNRAVAEELDRLLDGEPGPVASWHPAIAIYADRDWRVLPFADLPAIVRYEQAAGAAGIVLSAYYPPDLGVERLGTRYLVLPVPEPEGDDPVAARWNLEIARGDSIRTVGRLVRAR